MYEKLIVFTGRKRIIILDNAQYEVKEIIIESETELQIEELNPNLNGFLLEWTERFKHINDKLIPIFHFLEKEPSLLKR